MGNKILMLMLIGYCLVLSLGCLAGSGKLDATELTDSSEKYNNKPLDLSELPDEAKIIFEKLNRGGDEIDVVECPDQYPGRVTSGETDAWISRRKEELEELGFIAKWNCDTKVYELFEAER